ncbi:MAG: multicopper oxidase domain-containing protein [Thermoplasmatota archaeon]
MSPLLRALLASFCLALPAAVAVAPPDPAAAPATVLAIATQAVEPTATCPPAAPVVTESIAAVAIPIVYNHWGDWDPQGRLLVRDADLVPLLQDLAADFAQAGLATWAGALREAAVLAADGDPTLALARIAALGNATAADAGHATDGGPLAADVTALRPLRDAALDNLGEPVVGRLDVVALEQPLTLRMHEGECLRLQVRDLTPEPVGIDVHGLVVAPGEGMALASDAPRLVLPGRSGTVLAYAPAGSAGAHKMHSHADERFAARHGLFGAVVVEPRMAHWTGPDGSGAGDAQAILKPHHGAAWREFVVYYHDEVELLDHLLRPLPVIGTLGSEYGPGTKAINLRSEPFMDRFDFTQSAFEGGALPHGFDKSLAYSSYANGDPGTFLPRAYVGDPTRFLILNVGPGQAHVHHLHGGGTRWRASPGADDTQMDDGLMKHAMPPLSASDRIDVQTVGVGESFQADIEGGAGGAQQSVGDFLLHCHIVEHYMSGMWALWRVHNTLQPGLAELPDRHGGTPAAVPSTGLVGRRMPDGTRLTAATLLPWVQDHLPPQGVPGDNDASVWDWTSQETRHGPLVLGEPNDTHTWPNHAGDPAATRPPVLFNPRDGRPAYPLLTPHLGKRPPFAPGHGPAPFLGPAVAPGHPDGLCPADARPVAYEVVATGTTLHYNAQQADPKGQIFVLAQDKAVILDGSKPATSLVLRANQGDCVDVLLSSQVTAASPQQKVDIHIHLVQFDMQGSDGVVAGYNYEQAVLPATTTGTALATPAAAGDTTLRIAAGAGALRVGATIGVGLTEASLETARVVRVGDGTVDLDRPLAAPHPAGARVGPEFVRYRWYADAELGTVYWHDHVDGLNSWRHGLFGTLVVEPRGSQWCDPKRPAAERDHCASLREGHVADIVNGDATVAATPRGSFRELVLQFQDRACTPLFAGLPCSPDVQFPAAPGATQEPASFNLRSAPFTQRDVAQPFNSSALLPSGLPQGDPATDTLQAYPGDSTVVRLVYTGQSQTRGVATFAVGGHRFRREAGLEGSATLDRVGFGISSQHNLWLDCGAGGCQREPGDYLYFVAEPEHLVRGAWGLLRVNGNLTGLPTLPSNPAPATSPPRLGPIRHYDVVALEATVTQGNQGQAATRHLFVPASQEAAILAGNVNPEPLVLRVNAGETLEVNLTNHLAAPVTFAAGLLQPATPADLGMPVGRTAATIVPPGGARTYRYVADRDLGAAYVTSFGKLNAAIRPSGEGLYGLVVVEPANTTFSTGTGAAATLTLADGTTVREQALQFASADNHFESSVMFYLPDVAGPVTANERTEPLSGRVGSAGDGRFLGVTTCTFDDQPLTPDCGQELAHADARNPANPFALFGPDPFTPLVAATAGKPLVLRVAVGGGDQGLAFTLHGHAWARDPAMPGCRSLLPTCASVRASAVQLGTGSVANVWLPSAGNGHPGDYLWSAGRAAFTEAGAWGVLRVA